MTATTLDEPTRVVKLPERAAEPRGALPIGQVLAEVIPIHIHRGAPRSHGCVTGNERRCAALNATGAWRRAHPGATFEEDMAAAERIARQYGADLEDGS